MIQRVNKIYWLAIVATLLLIWRTLSLSPVFNSDGVTYLQTAGQFLTQGAGAFGHLNQQGHWPFYSIIIASITYVTGWSALCAAYLLGAIFQVATVLIFLKIIQGLGGDRKTQWWGLLVILSWHSFTNYWSDLLRDHGYNLFFLLSIWFFMQYHEKPRWLSVFGWVFSTIIMFLFRREGLVYLIFAPIIFCMLQGELKHSFSTAVKLLMPAVIGIALLSLLVVLNHWGDNIEFGKFTRFTVDYLQRVSAHFDHGVTVISHHVVGHFAEYQAWGLAGMLLAMFAAALMVVLGPSSLLGLIYLKGNKQALPPRHKKVLLCYGLIGLLIGLIFMFQTFFISKRYLVSLGLLVSMLMPFVLQSVFDDHAKKVWRVFFVLAIVYSLVASLFSFGRDYIVVEKQAGLWLQSNVLADATIASNSKTAIFYASQAPLYTRGYLDSSIKAIAKQCASYIVWSSRSSGQPKRQFANYTLMKTFSAYENRRVVRIYKLSSNCTQ